MVRGLIEKALGEGGVVQTLCMHTTITTIEAYPLPKLVPPTGPSLTSQHARK